MALIGLAGPFDVRIGEAIEKVNGVSVTSAFFRESKVLPMVGRLFLDEEYQTEGAHVVVIAASLWRRRFRRGPSGDWENFEC